MARYEGIKIVLISPKELSLPDYVKAELDNASVPYTEVTSLDEAISELDILYMTRIQRERFSSEEEYKRLEGFYILNAEKLGKAKEDMCILHPLPRVNEISVDVDNDPRACYFRQALYGKYIRMALILKLLSEKGSNYQYEGEISNTHKCTNNGCIMSIEQELEQRILVDENGKCRCAFCEAEL
jgi:aspartate carbamoyltransferase catalytic subunit